MEEIGVSCDHYIRAIKGGAVTLVSNRDSRGRPAPRIRSLRDINESEYARRARMCENVKVEAPVYERPSEDQSDLYEPIINLISKAPKRRRAQRKSAGRKSEETLEAGPMLMLPWHGVAEPTLELTASRGVDVNLQAHDADILPLAIDYGEETLMLPWPGVDANIEALEDEFLEPGAKLTSASPNIGAETLPCIKNDGRAIATNVSSPKTYSHPEKLKRKIIFPGSREQLRLAINSERCSNDNDKRKEKLSENEKGKNTSPLESNNGGLGGTGQAIKKPDVKQTADDLPSRAYPNIRSSRNSILGCSKSAIEFSKHQLVYTENVTERLTKALKSMKGIVEKKLLSQAHLRGYSKNDVDEAKSAIDIANKAMKKAKKGVSNMTIDCKRFRQIMKATPPTSVASKNTVCSGEKKISFADDAGGELCEYKEIENCLNSRMSDVVKKKRPVNIASHREGV